MEYLKSTGKYNQYTADKPRIGHFREFLKNEDIIFSDNTSGLLERFQEIIKNYHVGKFSKKSQTPKKAVANEQLSIIW